MVVGMLALESFSGPETQGLRRIVDPQGVKEGVIQGQNLTVFVENRDPPGEGLEKGAHHRIVTDGPDLLTYPRGVDPLRLGEVGPWPAAPAGTFSNVGSLPLVSSHGNLLRRSTLPG
jgi:hypothetical protein